MMRNVRPAIRRALAIALLIAPMYVLVVGIVQPVVEERRQARLVIDQATISLGRYRQILREHTAESSATQVSMAQSDLAPGFIVATNETLAAVELQNRMRTLVEINNGVLRSMQMLTTRAEDKSRRISLRVQVSLGMNDLRNLIHATESSDPYLFIDGMELRIRTARMPTPSDHVPAGDGSGLLEMRLDVSAYMHAPAL